MRSPDYAERADAAVRAVAAIGLLAAGIIHALEIRGQLTGAVWLTVGFCVLAVTAPAAGIWLLVRPGPLAWLGGGLICLSAGLGYVLTRSLPMPGDGGDVGNWLEPLGVTALMIEAVVVFLATFALIEAASTRSWPGRSRPAVAVVKARTPYHASGRYPR